MGVLDDLWKGFSGAGAKEDIDKGIGAVQANTGKQTGAITDYGKQATDAIKPFVNDAKGFKAYADSTGANGVGAVNSAFDSWLKNNPLQAKLAQDQKVAGWGANAGGNGPTTPVANLAANRVAMQSWADGYQNPLLKLAQMEQGAAGTEGQFDMATGAGIAGAYGGESNALANLYGKRADTENTLAQNVIGLGGGLAVSAYTGMPVGRGGGAPASRGTNYIGSSVPAPPPGFPYSGISYGAPAA